MRSTTQKPGLREQVERALGRPLAETTWLQLVDLGFEEELEQGAATPEEIAARVRDFGDTWRDGPARIPAVGESAAGLPGGALLALRASVVSEIATVAASVDGALCYFRETFLPDGQPIPEDAINGWVVAQYRSKLPSGWPVTGDPAVGDAHYKANAEVQLNPRFKERHAVLQWAERNSAGDWRAGCWPVPLKSPLARLVTLMQHLHDRWLWSEPEAFLFVVCGRTPHVPTIKGSATVRNRELTEALGWHDIFSRVTIEVDPTVSPEQLAAWWRDVRRRVLPRRYRPMSEKHLQLARFSTRRDESTTWEQDRRAWNTAFPEWAFDDRGNFRQAVLQGRDRLVRVGFQSL